MEIVVYLMYQFYPQGGADPIVDDGRQLVADTANAVGMQITVGETTWNANMNSTWTLYDHEVEWEPEPYEHNGHTIRIGRVNFVVPVS